MRWNPSKKKVEKKGDRIGVEKGCAEGEANMIEKLHKFGMNAQQISTITGMSQKKIVNMITPVVQRLGVL